MGKSSPRTVKRLERYGVSLHKQLRPGMGQSRIEAFQHASGKKPLYLWQEPEKNLIPQIPTIAKPLIEGSADIVVPEREGFRNFAFPYETSYSYLQRCTEIAGNLFLQDLLNGRYFDIWFGPKMTVEEYLDLLTCDYTAYTRDISGNKRRDDALWYQTFGLVPQGIHDGARAVGVEIPYEHPSEQALEIGDTEFNLKRMYQLWFLINALKNHYEALNQ